VTGEDHLEGDDPVKIDLKGLVDDAHAAPAQLLQHLVAGHGRPDRSGRRLRRCREPDRRHRAGQRNGWAVAPEDGVDERGVSGQAPLVLLRQRPLAAARAVVEIEPKQLAQQGRAARFGDIFEEVLDARPRQPGVLEAVANGVQAPGQVQRQRLVVL
jgi:hypothetical protein